MMLEGDQFPQMFRLALREFLALLGDFDGHVDDFLAMLVGMESDRDPNSEDQPGMFRQNTHVAFLIMWSLNGLNGPLRIIGL
jgi:hypothetical protein